MKECPYCAEKIQNNAVKCRHCGAKLESSSLPSHSNINPDSNIDAIQIYNGNKSEISSIQSTAAYIGGGTIFSIFSGFIYGLLNIETLSDYLENIPGVYFIGLLFVWFLIVSGLTSLIVHHALSTIRIGYKNLIIELTLKSPLLTHEQTLFFRTDNLGSMAKKIYKFCFPSLCNAGYYHRQFFLFVLGNLFASSTFYLGCSLSLYIRYTNLMYFIYSIPFFAIMSLLLALIWRKHPLLE